MNEIKRNRREASTAEYVIREIPIAFRKEIEGGDEMKSIEWISVEAEWEGSENVLFFLYLSLMHHIQYHNSNDVLYYWLLFLFGSQENLQKLLRFI